MRIASVKVDLSVGERETTHEQPAAMWRTFEAAPQDSSVEITMRLVPENEADFDRMTTKPELQLVEWATQMIADSTNQGVPMPGLSPFIVVSIRPQIDGAPSMSQAIERGTTQLMPLGVVAIAPSGELVRFSLPLEVRADLA